MKSSLVGDHERTVQFRIVEQSEPQELRSLQTVKTTQPNNLVFRYL